MKPVLFALPLVLILSGCTAQQVEDTQAKVNEIVALTVTKATEICGFVPDTAPLITIVTKALTQGTIDGGDLAQKICSLVTAKSVTPNDTCPAKIDDVCVTGHFKE